MDLDPVSSPLLESLREIAPGTPLREALDRCLQAHMGALVLVGDGPEVLEICSGGFLLDAEFSPQRMAELAKMDGALILAPDASRIARANVHLVPNPNTPTSETGTRHRTAERVARSIDVPVVAVSEEMSVITLYRGEEKHRLDSTAELLFRGNQALQTLERYVTRQQEVADALTTAEIEDLVALRDVLQVLQRAEMVGRISSEVEVYAAELGEVGRLLMLQLRELLAGLSDDSRLVLLDYLQSPEPQTVASTLADLDSLASEELIDMRVISQVAFPSIPADDLDLAMEPRGWRLLSQIPRLSQEQVGSLACGFGNLQKLLRASVDELAELPGIDRATAVAVKEGLSRLTELSLIDRFG